jgi:D-Tyr-tRNAtyr deacylase
MQNSEKKITRAMDRGESIKRAEEMLSQFIVESQTQKFKRPEFMRNKRGKSQGDALELIPRAEEIAGIIRNGQVTHN